MARRVPFDGRVPILPEAAVTFRVNIPALRGLPPFLDRRHADLVAAGTYLSTYTPLKPGGYIDPIAPRHAQVIAAIDRFLTDAKIYVNLDAVNVRDALESYATSDARAAARADAGLPDYPAPPPPTFDPGGDSLNADVFADTANPATLLVPPTDQRSTYAYQPSWTDLLSPTTVIRDVIWGLTKVAADVGLLDRAYDPFELLVEPFTGDVGGLLVCAEVFVRLADLLDAVGSAVVVADRVVPLVWTGHASDACQVNLARFATDMSEAARHLRGLAETYRAVVSGLLKAQALAAQLVTTIVDVAVDSGLDEIGIGLLYTVPNLFTDFVSLINKFTALVQQRNEILMMGFAPADFTHPFGILRAPVKLPDLELEGPQIPNLLPPPRTTGRVPVAS